MSSILKALRKLEQDSNEGGAAIDPWERKTDWENAMAREPRGLRPRTMAFYLLFVPLLAIGGWLLLKYDLPSAEKSQSGKPMPQSMGSTPVNMSAGSAPASGKTDLKPKAKSSARISQIKVRKESATARKTVVTSRKGGRILEKRGGKLPAVGNKTQAKMQLKSPAKKPRVDSKSFKTARVPGSASGSPSQRDLQVLNKNNKFYPPPVRSNPPRTLGKPNVSESSALPGFSVQAIAWSKIPGERIAVINAQVVREGEFVEGVQVTQIGIDDVSLKKGHKTWLLKCGR